MKQRQQPPLWLRRLDLVKAEMKTTRFPRTAAEGFRQCAELPQTARRWFVDSIRQDHPGATEEEIEQERRLLLARFSAAQTRWIKQWKKERDLTLDDKTAALLSSVAKNSMKSIRRILSTGRGSSGSWMNLATAWPCECENEENQCRA